MAAVVPYSALAIITNLLSGIGGTVPKFIGWGTQTGQTSARADTTLFTEAQSQENDGTHNRRVQGTVSRVTTAQTNDTLQVTGTLLADTARTITNVGLFDTNGQAANLSTAPSGGNLFAKADIGGSSGFTLATNDGIAFTLQVQFT